MSGINKTQPGVLAQTLRSPWVLNRERVVVQSDQNGQYFIVRQGDTASTIALSLKNQGHAIPSELEAHYVPKPSGWRTGDVGRHEGNLRVGEKFYLPRVGEAKGQTYDAWLNPLRLPEMEASTPVAPPAVPVIPEAPSVNAVDLQSVAPKFAALVEGTAPTSVSFLQKTLADELAALPAGTDRAAVAAQVDQYVSAHRGQLNKTGSDKANERYGAQLSYVANAWAKDPAVLNDRDALWVNGTKAFNAVAD